MVRQVLRGQDIIVLLSVLDAEPGISVRDLSSDLTYAPASTHRSLQRLAQAGLYDARRGRVPVAAAEEFLLHAVKYVFRARTGGETRGVIAAWAAEPLASRLAPTDDLPPVWPHAAGRVRGVDLPPLHEIAVSAAQRDPRLARRLALVDTLRAGDARLRQLAADLLREDLRAT